ncbi:MAG TPA: 16S rRNA (adenine(1518)-N(6)/adenine(1519)-N(6))-dimethyltransferase RsmA [Anaerolineaceae bacterium]
MATSLEQPTNPAAMLKSYGLHPKKNLGQNFLVDPAALERVVAAAEIHPDDSVLEIGAGLGGLTLHLAAAASRVVAVEIDRQLLPILTANLSGQANVEIQPGDMLELDPAILMGSDGYVVVANIPYYITSALIRHLLEARVKPARVTLTVQKEVAQRITAEPGEMSLLALSVQVYGNTWIAARIPAGAFYPAPNVDSAVVRVDLYPEPVIPAQQLPAFFKLIKAGFSQKRKTLRNALAAGLHFPAEQALTLLTTAAIDPQRRAETLSLPEWSRLVQVYTQKPG